MTREDEGHTCNTHECTMLMRPCGHSTQCMSRHSSYGVDPNHAVLLHIHSRASILDKESILVPVVSACLVPILVLLSGGHSCHDASLSAYTRKNQQLFKIKNLTLLLYPPMFIPQLFLIGMAQNKTVEICVPDAVGML